MRTQPRAWTSLAAAIAVPLWLLAVPASAQSHGSSHGGGGGAGSGGGGHAVASGGGGGAAAGGGSGASSGGSTSGSSGSSSASGGGGHATASGTASGGHVSTGGGHMGHTGHPAAGSPRSEGGGTAVPRGTSGTTGSTSGNGTIAGGAPAYARPNDGQPVVGHAVPRTGSTPVPGGSGTTILIPGYYGGFYPWAFGGLGFYGAGFYDPWFGAEPYDPYDPFYAGQSYSASETGGLKLKIKPNNATVYIDGYYVGVVDDYDGVFQKLSIEPGVHRVEVRAPGYETLSFEVRVEPGHTTTYRGELKKLSN